MPNDITSHIQQFLNVSSVMPSDIRSHIQHLGMHLVQCPAILGLTPNSGCLGMTSWMTQANETPHGVSPCKHLSDNVLLGFLIQIKTIHMTQPRGLNITMLMGFDCLKLSNTEKRQPILQGLHF